MCRSCSLLKYVFVLFLATGVNAMSLQYLMQEKGNLIFMLNINTFTAIVDLSRFNNSCLKSPASTLVDLIIHA